MVLILDVTGLSVFNTFIRIQNFWSFTFYILIHKLFIFRFLYFRMDELLFLSILLVNLVLNKKPLPETK